MSRPTTRVLALLETLQDRGRVSGPELAERLGVDQRTVRRYAARLQDLGYPVEAERGRYGGYRLRPGYKLPPLMLTDEEAVAVVLGLTAARHLGMATAAPAVDGALAKLYRVLPVALRRRVRALEETMGFTGAGRRPAAPLEPATVLTLAEAARLRRRVRVRYRSGQGEEGERDLDPYGLVFHAGRWYLAAFDHRHGEPRTFRVDRVAAAELRPERVAVPDGFDAVEHVTRSLARVPWTHEVEVLLETTLAEARRRIPATAAELAEADGGVLLRARAERLDGAARMLASLGWRFTVRRPDELRAAVRDLAGTLAALADR